MSAISLDSLNGMPREDFVAALGGVFEHSPWIAEAAADRRPFASLALLFAAMKEAVESSDERARMALIAGHPDLAGKAMRAGDLTSDSASEQNGAGLDRLSEAEYARFHELNRAYRERFGFLFMVCVRRHTKDSILREFERRLKNDPVSERRAALTEIERIAALRLDDLVEAQDRLPVNGRLSTHVLDTYSGRPAKGVNVELVEMPETGKPRLLANAVTNAGGRTDEPLIFDQPIPIGTYELRFDVGAYYRAAGLVLPEPAFLGTVPLRFAIAEPEGNYHVPLVMTPWSYSTYRGS